jgi:two-component sensor histidine kinase
MLGHLGEMLSSEGFMPHGMCILWRPDLLWLHAGSDALIALAYYSIPVALIYFVRRRKDLVFPTVFILFGAFIFACGTTHVLGVWTIWHPDYWVEGAVKAATAAISVVSAILLWRVVPSALAIPNRGQLEAANRLLAGEVEARSRDEEEARRRNLELERRVAERTADLETTNDRLRAALAEKDVLLREVQHRVKNNLQVVSGLLALQARNAPDFARPFLQQSLERIRAMSRVHHQLYESDDARLFAADALVRDLCADLGHADDTSGQQVTCRVEAGGSVKLALDAAVPLALIVNEVLSNAFMYAFPGERTGEIVISLAEDAQAVRIEIRDDGVGMGEDWAARQPQPIGTRLVQMLASQLGGKAAWSTHDGTTFTLVIPVR